MSNIYLELELSLDPPITDAAALEIYLNEQIKQWNKQVNANPKFKLKVQKAKEYIKSGLRNLQAQADEARRQKLQELRTKIDHFNQAGDVDDSDIKVLNNSFKNYFTEVTIRGEAIGTTEVKPAIASFQAPQQPVSLKCEKPVSFADMRQIAEWLQNVKGGQHHNLYELLGMSKTATKEVLSAKSKEEADKILKMPKNTIEADFLNKLAQKFLLFFKDDTNRRGYDISLKRFPFDKLCDDKFRTFARKFKKKEETDWKLYRDSVIETLQLGLTQEEAEWLVYDFYCVKQNCPQPVPAPEPRGFIDTMIGSWNKVTQTITQPVKKIRERIKNHKPPEQTVIIHREIYGPTEPSEPAPQPVSPSANGAGSVLPETEPLLPVTPKQIVSLFNAKKYMEIYILLSPYQRQNKLQEKYYIVWDKICRKIEKADKRYLDILQKIQTGDIDFVPQSINELQQFAPDYRGIKQLYSELRAAKAAIFETAVEIRNLKENRHYYDAETKLRRFLADYPNYKDNNLLTLIPQIEEGINNKIAPTQSNSFVFALLFSAFSMLAFGAAINMEMFSNEVTPEATKVIDGAWAGGQILACIAASCWLVVGIKLLWHLPAILRRMSVCSKLKNTDFGKPKLSKTVWYARLEMELRQK